VVAVVVEAARGNVPSLAVIFGMALAIAGVAIVSLVAIERAPTERDLVQDVGR
jgi:hypothetical protein